MDKPRSRALIVEDEGVTLLLLNKALAAGGYEIVGTAVNGEEAIDIARMTNPDFILMDTQMPVMNGVEATRRILSERSVPIIMLTALADNESVEAALEAGACCYVTKPVTSSDLIETIEDALAQFEQEQADTAKDAHPQLIA